MRRHRPGRFAEPEVREQLTDEAREAHEERYEPDAKYLGTVSAHVWRSHPERNYPEPQQPV